MIFRLQGQDLPDAVFGSEHPVTMVAGGHAHDGAGPVIHQYVVGDPDLYLFAGQRMDAVHARVHAQFFRFTGGPFDIGGVLHLIAESFQFGFLRVVLQQFFHHGMFRRDDHESNAVDGIRTGGVHHQFLVQAGHVETEFQTFAAADPVALHGLYPVGPALQLVQIIQQLFGIVGDLEEPLAQLFLLHRLMAAPAFAVFHLFVGQHRAAGIAPVHGSFLLHSQAPFVHQFKEPLGPFVVFFLAGGHLPVPVVGKPQFLQLTGHVGNVFHGPFRRGDVVLDGRIFCRHPEGVEADGVQHVEAPHGAEPGHYVADGVVAHMAHVQVAGRIREHFQHIGFGPGIIVLHLVGLVVGPVLLPPGFNLMRFILFLEHEHTSY